MDERFRLLVETLSVSFDGLLECPPHTGPERLPTAVPRCAVYLFSEGEEHLYVGRTDRLRARHREHLSGTQNDAPFAFKLARRDTGYTTKGKPTRAALMSDPAFQQAFIAAKKRVASMKFRWVEEANANRQCLLEIYATIVLQAEYNDFINH